MPSYANEELLTEDIRIKISPTLRRLLEERARQRRQSMNAIVRESLETTLHEEDGHANDNIGESQ